MRETGERHKRKVLCLEPEWMRPLQMQVEDKKPVREAAILLSFQVEKPKVLRVK